MSEPATTTGAREGTALSLALGLWAVGAQVHEALATAGGWLTAAVVLAGLSAQVARTRALPVAWRLWWPLPAFLAWATLVPLVAGQPPTGTGLARLSDWVLLPVAAVAVARVPAAGLRRVGLVAVAVLVTSCVLAALQHLGAWPREEALQSLAWTRLPFSRVYEHVPGRDDRFMAGGLLFHRLKFANVSAVVVVLATAAAVRPGLGPPPRGARWLFGAAAAVGTVSVALFPHARAATVALVLAVAVTWLLGAANRRLAALGAGGVVLLVTLAVLVTPSLRTRFSSSLTAEGSGERGALTQAGLDAVAAHPLSGVGPGRFKPGLFAGPDAPSNVREHQGKAHNQLVSIAAEAGVPAALLVLTLVALLGRELWRRRPAGVAGLGVLALFVLLGALHDPLFHVESSLALMLGLGGAVGFARRPSAADAG